MATSSSYSIFDLLTKEILLTIFDFLASQLKIFLSRLQILASNQGEKRAGVGANFKERGEKRAGCFWTSFALACWLHCEEEYKELSRGGWFSWFKKDFWKAFERKRDKPLLVAVRIEFGGGHFFFFFRRTNSFNKNRMCSIVISKGLLGGRQNGWIHLIVKFLNTWTLILQKNFKLYFNL